MSLPTVAITTAAGSRPVSALALGTMYFGTRTERATSFAVLDRFAEAGGTFLDTANNYNQWFGRGGESEQLIGEWLTAHGHRDELVLASKCGAQMISGTDPDQNWQGLGATTIAAAVQRSLSRLGVDRIDLYYAHIDDRATPLAETVGAFGQLVADGVVDAIGASNIATWRLAQARDLAALNGSAPYTVVQQEHTYLWPRPEPGLTTVLSPELLDYRAANPDLTVCAYSPLLAGAYSRPDEPLPGNRGYYSHPSAQARWDVLRTVAAEVGATPNQVVLAWMIRAGIIPIFGASSLAQLNEALAAGDLELDDATIDRLNAA